MYLDIHAHFAEEGYDLAEELKKIAEAGVKRLVLASDSVVHANMHREIAEQTQGLYFTAGVHPSETENFGEETLLSLQALCASPKCIAVGEIGLDYHYPDTDKAAQWEAFTKQLGLADRLALPVQIHSRDACADTLAILREHREEIGNGFLLHCYSYGAESMREFLELGAYFSFGGVTCFKNAKKAVESVRLCPAERILSETDSPYLSPFRGEKNTPANIPVIVNRMAEIRGETAETLKERIRENAFRLFPKLA